MYVVVYNNKVIYGPAKWNRALIKAAMDKKGFSNVLVHRNPPTLPYQYGENLTAYDASIQTPTIDPMFESTHGPYWNFEGNVAIGTLEKKYLPIETIKNNLISMIAELRWKKEVEGIKVTLKDQEVTVLTDRESRNVPFQSLMLLNDGDTVRWKFPERWLEIDKSALQIIVAAGVAYIKECFDWEKTTAETVIAAKTVKELQKIYEELTTSGEE